MKSFAHFVVVIVVVERDKLLHCNCTRCCRLLSFVVDAAVAPTIAVFAVVVVVVVGICCN